MATGMNTTEARRRVRIAQFAGLGLGVMAAALWALDVPGLSKGLPQKPFLPAESGGSGPVVAALPQIDRDASSGIGERLEMAANHPTVKPVDPPPAGNVVPPPVASGTPWKYLGPIQEATRIRALVSIDGSQKIV